MFCSHCGTRIAQPVCPVCGTNQAGTPASTDRTTSRYASWGMRVIATVVDNLILLAPLYLVGTFQFGGLVGALAVGLALQGWYLVFQQVKRNGQTIGNRAARSRVLSASTGLAPTTRQAVRRWAFVVLYNSLAAFGGTTGLLLVVVIAACDYCCPFVDPQQRTLHDRFAGTVVVRLD